MAESLNGEDLVRFVLLGAREGEGGTLRLGSPVKDMLRFPQTVQGKNI